MRLATATFGLASLALFGAAPIVARAQMSAGVTTESQIDVATAEVQQPFTFRFSVMTDENSGAPSSPSLHVPPGFSVRGPSVGTKQQVTLSMGRVVSRRGISATWTLVASKPGSYTIGPPSASVGGRRVVGRSRSVTVVEAGRGGKRRLRPSTDPFDLFRGVPGFRLGPLFGNPDDGSSENDDLDFLPPFPDELAVDVAADPIAFLRAEATPLRPVVGEQVTLKIFAYGGRGPFREVNTSEPSRAGFLSYPIVENSYGEKQYEVPIDGHVWHAVKVREIALFPIHTGQLSIGSFRMGFSGRRYPAVSPHKGLVRYSRPVNVVASEPPVDGRPSGYRIGDVGRFALSATVEPRVVPRGEAVSVVVRIEGTGNLPHRIDVPSQHGVEWLDPTMVDDVGPHGSTIAGWRKLTYLARLERSGILDLGEIELPYWDPSRDAYGVAKAPLGTVSVTGSADEAGEKTSSENHDPLAILDEPRHDLGTAAKTPSPWTDRPAYWVLLLAGPLGVVLTGASFRTGRRLRRRWQSRGSSRAAQAARAIRDAWAETERDAASAASAVERAVFLAIEGATGLRARAILRRELESSLIENGLPRGDSEEACSLLTDCDALRFEAGGLPPTTSPGDLVRRAARLVKKLRRLQPKRR